MTQQQYNNISQLELILINFLSTQELTNTNIDIIVNLFNYLNIKIPHNIINNIKDNKNNKDNKDNKDNIIILNKIKRNIINKIEDIIINPAQLKDFLFYLLKIDIINKLTQYYHLNVLDREYIKNIILEATNNDKMSRSILVYYYILGYNQTEIASMYNIKQQYVSNILNNTIERMCNNYEFYPE